LGTRSRNSGYNISTTIIIGSVGIILSILADILVGIPLRNLSKEMENTSRLDFTRSNTDSTALIQEIYEI